jgi:hypothetical protein
MNDPVIEKALKDLSYAKESTVTFADAQRTRLNVIRDLHKYKMGIPRGDTIRIQCENLMSQAEEEWSIEEDSHKHPFVEEIE